VLALVPTKASAANPEAVFFAFEQDIPPPPPKGNAMYGLGIASVTFGILNLGYGIPLAIICPGDACFSGYIGIGFGAAFIAAGAPAIYFGKWRREVYRRWEGEFGMLGLARQHRRWARARLTISTPTPWLLPRGGGVGIVGRF
jgi:hypothetical protein